MAEELIAVIETDLKKFFPLLSDEDLRNGKKISSFYGDYAPKHKKERELLNAFLTCNGHLLLMSHKKDTPTDFIISADRLVTDMMSASQISKENARDLCTAYWNAIHNSTGKKLWQSYTYPIVYYKDRDTVFLMAEKYLAQRKTPIPSQNILRKKDYDQIRELKIPDHIQIIAKDAFSHYNCYGITEFTFPSSLEYIEPGSFYGLQNLKRIFLPIQNRYTYTDGFLIDTHTQTLLFAAHRDILKIPSSVKNIAPGALIYPQYLEIPKTVEIIDFGNLSTYTLKHIEVEKGHPTLRSQDGVLYNAALDELLLYPGGKTESSYTSPSSLRKIARGAFSGNDFLKSITLSEGLETIADIAFSNCKGLKKIQLPTSLKSMGKCAFNCCGNLHQITLPPDINYLGDEVFRLCGADFSTNETLDTGIGMLIEAFTGKEYGDYSRFQVKSKHNPYIENYCRNNHIKYKRIP